MGDQLVLNIGLISIGAMVLLLLLFILFCSDACRSPRRGPYRGLSIDMINTLGQEFLLRENLEDTILEDGRAEWQCVVCLHLNHPDVGACHLCGAAQEASTLLHHTTLLSDTAIMGNTVLGATFLSNYGGGAPASNSTSSGFDALGASDISMQTRQRALRYRRLNRMQLTQRQRGAQRRRLWQRVRLPNGAFIWVRTAVDVAPHQRRDHKLIARLRNNTLMRRDPHANDLSETIAEQLHRKNAATLGFYSDLDAQAGIVSWKKTTESVAIPIEEDGPSLLFEPEIDLEGLMSLPFKEKKRWFLKKIASIAIPYTKSLTKIKVRRAHVLADSVAALTELPTTDDKLREHLNVTFDGEPALDAGGVLREWFGLVCKELFAHDLGLFITTQGESASYWINPASAKVLGPERHLEYFRFAGRLLGKAFLEDLIFDAHLALPLLKHLLGVPITFSDLEFLDEELYKSCVWMRDNEGVEHLCVTFSVAGATEGELIDLKPGGQDIDVTDDNKLEYLALLLRYRMLDSVSEQLGALLTGLFEVIPKSYLAIFDYQELDFFMCGLPIIDVRDWEQHSRIRHFSGETDHEGRAHERAVVGWFWEVVQGFSDEERARLLQFASGSSRVPVEGFKALTSASGYVHQFCLQLVPRGTPPLGLCPRAHTCFNRIDLPIYKDKEELETYLTLVIQMEITGFGFE